MVGANCFLVSVTVWFQIYARRDNCIQVSQPIFVDENFLHTLRWDNDVLAHGHKITQPVLDRAFQEILESFLGNGHIVGIFLVLRMESKDQRQIKFFRLSGSSTPQQKRVMGMDHVQLQGWQQLIDKG